MPSNRVRPPLRQDEDSNDAGFTVLEVLVAFVLFAVLAGASTTAIVNATAAANISRDRVNAANVAEQDIQQARSLRYPNYPQPVAAHTVTVGNKKYTVTRAIPSPCPVSSDPNNPGLTWTPGQATSMQVITTVTWPGSTTGVSIATEMAC
jgi:prepilin-type N-terminal cleavage/methylation domain-containing protein